jgi:hypothetical protein
MTAYMRSHVKYVNETLSSPDADASAMTELYVYHNLVISRMQHERLIHLLVTLFTAALFLFALVLMFTMAQIQTAVFCTVAAVLLVFYVVHYFKLENGVQKLYRLGDRIRDRLLSQSRET